jgi:hypothetical protein
MERKAQRTDVRSGKTKPRFPKSKKFRKPMGSKRRPTLVLDVHASINANFNVTSSVKQINIAPSLSVFDKAVQQAKFYQQYKISRVQYKVLPKFNYA